MHPVASERRRLDPVIRNRLSGLNTVSKRCLLCRSTILLISGKRGGERVEPHQATRVGRTARKKRPGSRWANVLICRSSKVISVKDPCERWESRDLFPHCRGPVKSCTGGWSSANAAVKSRGYTCVDYKLTTYYRQSPGGHCLSGILPQGFLSVKTDGTERAGAFLVRGMAAMPSLAPIGKTDPSRSVLQ